MGSETPLSQPEIAHSGLGNSDLAQSKPGPTAPAIQNSTPPGAREGMEGQDPGPIHVQIPSIHAHDLPTQTTDTEPLCSLPFGLRDLKDGDKNFIRHSWKRAYFRHSNVSGSVYWRMMGRRVELLLKRAAWVVACNEAEENQIFGWACAEAPLLHFVFVKELYRGNGVAEEMVSKLNTGYVDGPEWKILCTHWTPDAAAIAKKHSNLLNVEI